MTKSIVRMVSSVIDHEAAVAVGSASTRDICKIATELGAEVVPYEWDG